MPAHRDNQKAEAMYDLYRQGHSLAVVGKVFNTSRQGVYKMFALRGYALRILSPAPFILWEGRKYTLRTNGYYARSRGGRQYLHRAVWERENGPIPAGFDVHHRDGDKTNNVIANLDLCTVSEHGQRHGFASNQFVRVSDHRPILR